MLVHPPELVRVEVDLDPALRDRPDALGGDVSRGAQDSWCDREAVEDVLAAVADDLVYRAELVPVAADDRPALLDQEPGDGIAQTVRPPTYQTGPWV